MILVLERSARTGCLGVAFWLMWWLEQLARGEVADEAAVSGEEVVFRQIFKPGPPDLVKDAILNLAREFMDGKELQVDCAAMAVVMTDVGDPRTNGCLDAEFFVELAGEGLLWTFASLDFSAGEFPLQGHRLIGTTLADENFAAADDECGGNETEGGTSGSCVWVWLGLFHSSSVNAAHAASDLAAFQYIARRGRWR